MWRRKNRVYFNTSLLIRAINPSEKGYIRARKFIDELFNKRYILVTSSILFEELIYKETVERIVELLEMFNFTVAEINVEEYRKRGIEWLSRRRLSEKHLLDVMHMMVARDLGCRYIAAIDRFIWRHAKDFNLVYINYYTGVPSNAYDE